MKLILDQIIFLDKKLLPLYGFKSIDDYNTKISENQITPTVLSGLNEIIKEWKKYYVLKDFSLHKTNFTISNTKHAMSFLKKCLTVTMVPYEYTIIKKIKWMRLISRNNILNNYIDNKMTEIRDCILKTENIDRVSDRLKIDNTPNMLVDGIKMPQLHELKYDEILKSIKKKTERIIYIPLINHYFDNLHKIVIQINDFFSENISNLEIELTKNGNALNEYLVGKLYSICIKNNKIVNGYNQNDLLLNMIYLRELNQYSNICIEFDDIIIPKNIQESIFIKITTTIIDFNHDILSLFHSKKTIVDVPFVTNNIVNYLRYNSGEISIIFSEINKKYDINRLELDGKFYTLTVKDKVIKCYEYTCEDKNKPHICPLVSPYENDMVIVPNYSLNKSVSHMIVDHKYVNLYIKLYDTRCADTIFNIKLTHHDTLNFKNMKLFIQLDQKICQLNYGISDNTIKVALDQNHHINSFCNVYHFTYIILKIPKQNLNDQWDALICFDVTATIVFLRKQYRDRLRSADLIVDLYNLL